MPPTGSRATASRPDPTAGPAGAGPALSSLEWRLIEPQPLAANLHLALDEVLLGRVARGERPATMRLWEWIEPALVIGSHQSVANEVDSQAAAALGFAVVRRMSGGGTMIAQPGGTITWSLYLAESTLAGMSFEKSYGALDAWAVSALQELGVDASYRPLNDIVSPRGKIAGAAQARRRGAVLHHTTMAYAMDAALVRRLIRLGRERLSAVGVRSADKEVSPLAWFTKATLPEVTAHFAASFSSSYSTRSDIVSGEELQQAQALVASKYGTIEWLLRVP